MTQRPHLTLVSPQTKVAKRATSKSVAFISKGYQFQESDWVFRREQSKASREMDWEGTVRFPVPYLTIILRCLAAVVALGAVVWVL